MNINEKITLIKKLADCLANLPVVQIPATDTGVLNFVNSHLYGIIKGIGADDTFLSLFHNILPFSIYEIKGRLKASFIVIKIPANDSFLIAGPCLKEPFSDHFLASVINKNKALYSCRETLEHYYYNLPVLSSVALQQFGQTMGECLFEATDLPYYRLVDEGHSLQSQSLLLVANYESVLPMRLLEQRYELSAALICAVKQGNLSLAGKLYQSLITDISQIHRSKNPLRNAQNLCIIMNSLLRSALQEIGIHPYLLDKISGEIGIKIENIQSYIGLQTLCEEILKRYCELAQDHHYRNVKPLIREAITYTLANLSDNLSVQIVANTLHVNPDYLSHLFSQETGLNFSAFVNQERIKQATTLLKHTHYPVKQIALSVGYNNTSYFTKQFQIYMNTTPTKYRKENA